MHFLSVSLPTHSDVAETQALMRAAIQEQEQATRAGLEYLQVAANKAALELMCKEQKDQLAEAETHARNSTLSVFYRLPNMSAD